MDLAYVFEGIGAVGENATRPSNAEQFPSQETPSKIPWRAISGMTEPAFRVPPLAAA